MRPTIFSEVEYDLQDTKDRINATPYEYIMETTFTNLINYPLNTMI
jgi:hypothetical protein